MKVGELIELLKQEDQDALVVCQKDPEGNGYSPLSDISRDGYVAETTWYGERRLLELTKEDRKAGYSEEDVNSNAEKAVFLCPVN